MRRLPSTDGVEVAVHDLGGPPDGRPLLLVHATGFGARAFDPLVRHAGDAFRSWGVDLRGHGLTLTPESVGYAWSGFADDVLAAVDGLGLEDPIGLGHSSGGAALLLAEARRPGTFSALWCYEPIVWPDPEAARGRAEWLAAGAARRRASFPSAEDAYENFRAKPPLSALAPEALRAYVEHCFEPGEDGSVTLRCRPEAEAAVYRAAVESDRFPLLGQVACPVVIAAGGRSDAIDPPAARALAAALPSGRTRVFEDLGHFGPLQDPPAVARALLADTAPR